MESEESESVDMNLRTGGADGAGSSSGTIGVAMGEAVSTESLFAATCRAALKEIRKEVDRLEGYQSNSFPRIVLLGTFTDWVNTAQQNVALRASNSFPEHVVFDEPDSWPFRFHELKDGPDFYLKLRITNPLTGQNWGHSIEESLIQSGDGLSQFADKLSDGLDNWIAFANATRERGNNTSATSTGNTGAGGRPAFAVPKVAIDCEAIVNNARRDMNRERVPDDALGEWAIENADIPDFITENIDANSEQLDLSIHAGEIGNLIKRAAKSPKK